MTERTAAGGPLAEPIGDPHSPPESRKFARGERRGYGLEVAYCGTKYSGFARQRDRRTVEGVLSAWLSGLGLTDLALAVAARTDAGVHARRQVVSFRTRAPVEVAALLRAADSLPADLRLRRAWAVDRSFHARSSARSRTYAYRFRLDGQPSASRVGLPDRAYDWPTAERFLAAQIGTHDRTPFTHPSAQGKETRLEALCISPSSAGKLTVWFRGAGFTRHLVRNWMAQALRLAREEPPFPADRWGFHGQPAPAQELVLWDVTYD